MGHRPSAWLTELVEGVAGCMEAHSPMGALGWRYHEMRKPWNSSSIPHSSNSSGGEHDGTIVVPGFSLDAGPPGRFRTRDGAPLACARRWTRR